VIGFSVPASDKKPVDIRVKRTHLLLRQALMELMPEKGFQAITVQDIVDRAMINRATFYEHFTDKYTLLEYSLRDLFRQTLAAQVPEESEFSTQNLRLLIITTYEFLAQLRRRCLPKNQQLLPVVQTQITSVIHGMLLTWLTEVPSSTLPRATTPEMAAAVMSWAIYGAAFYWSLEDRPEKIDTFVQRALPLIMTRCDALNIE
jgi:AcrR family transcriptional regulator